MLQDSHWKVVAILAVLAHLLSLFVSRPGFIISQCQDPHDNILIGYKILHHTLAKESDLKFLKAMRKATFRAPSDGLDRLLSKIATTSSTRGRELEKLWQQQLPTIDISSAPTSDIGQAIQDTAEFMGTKEMISFSAANIWSARFWFLQAQATRMIAAIARSLSKRDPNQIRRQWLRQLALEFEYIRDQVVEAVIVK